jgi:hypothetical protein
MRFGHRSSPASEPASGRRGIDPTDSIQISMSLGQVPSSVHENVCDRVPYFARRAQHVEMKAVRHDGAASLEDAIGCSSEPRTDRLRSVGRVT